MTVLSQYLVANDVVIATDSTSLLIPK